MSMFLFARWADLMCGSCHNVFNQRGDLAFIKQITEIKCPNCGETNTANQYALISCSECDPNGLSDKCEECGNDFTMCKKVRRKQLEKWAYGFLMMDIKPRSEHAHHGIEFCRKEMDSYLKTTRFFWECNDKSYKASLPPMERDNQTQ